MTSDLFMLNGDTSDVLKDYVGPGSLCEHFPPLTDLFILFCLSYPSNLYIHTYLGQVIDLDHHEFKKRRKPTETYKREI